MPHAHVFFILANFHVISLKYMGSVRWPNGGQSMKQTKQ